jgi:hypothetical protein
MAPGKTYDVKINVPAAGGTALPIFDREGSLSGNATSRDAGMVAYISVNGAGLPSAPAFTAAQANNDTYNSVISGQAMEITDPGRGVLGNDVNVYGVKVVTGSVTGGTLDLHTDGTFKFVADPTATTGSFEYCGNGATWPGPSCATVTLGSAPLEGAAGITCTVPTPTYTSNVATTLSIKPPGLLEFCKDAAGYPLTLGTASFSGTSLTWNADGSFTATAAPGATYTLTFTAKNSQGTSGATATATLVFPQGSGLAVTLVDGKKTEE